MSTTNRTPPPATALQRWVHTDIDAPGAFTVREFTMVETHRGVAYSAKLVHPTLGLVGLIDNEGCGGPTMFTSYDRARYGERDLETFLAQCRQEGQPMDTGPMGLETLLDEIINEAEFAGDVDRMRREDLFLIRSFEPATAENYGSRRGPALPFARPRLRRDERGRLAVRLAAMPEHRLQPGQRWQMFNGTEWVPLLGDPMMTAEQTADRLETVTDLLTRPDLQARLVGGVRLDEPDEELFLFGTPGTGRFSLIGDTTEDVKTGAWCSCARRRATVSFQRWDSHGLLESGTVHAARRCRRLVRID